MDALVRVFRRHLPAGPLSRRSAHELQAALLELSTVFAGPEPSSDQPRQQLQQLRTLLKHTDHIAAMADTAAAALQAGLPPDDALTLYGLVKQLSEEGPTLVDSLRSLEGSSQQQGAARACQLGPRDAASMSSGTMCPAGVELKHLCALQQPVVEHPT
ncbi:hypothetical protein ABPG75_005629 [Micractinium tetrahymenae]